MCYTAVEVNNMHTPEQVQEILRCLAQAYPADCSLQYQKDYELLFAVRLAAQCTDERVDLTDPRGPVLHVTGADLMDGTPIFDIKPYVAYADCHPEAAEGFTGQVEMQELTVTIPPEQLSRFPADKRDALIGVLAQDPRPRYQTDASRVYGLEFGGYEIKFRVDSQTLTVTDIIKKDS